VGGGGIWPAISCSLPAASLTSDVSIRNVSVTNCSALQRGHRNGGMRRQAPQATSRKCYLNSNTHNRTNSVQRRRVNATDRKLVYQAQDGPCAALGNQRITPEKRLYPRWLITTIRIRSKRRKNYDDNN
jgi:hypothetical protein